MIETINERGYIQFAGALIKADPKLKDILYIEASNEFEDSQGDTMLQKALVNQKNSYLQKGVVSYDHLQKLEKDPNYIIGEPVEVQIGEKRTLVKAKMYLANKYAAGIMAMANSGSSRIGASVGGWIKKRIQRIDEMTKSVKKYITDVIWDETALTAKPINEYTLGNVSVIPFAEFCKSFVSMETDPELYKALMAGAGTNRATMTGGRALVPESLQGASKKDKKLKRGIETILTGVKNGKVNTYQDLDSFLIKTDLVPHRKHIMNLIIQKI